MTVKNLLFVSWYTGLGGGETDLLSLAQELDPQQYRVHLLVPHEGKLSEKWREFGWQTHTLAWRGVTVYFVPSLWMRFPAVKPMARLLHELKIDLIHADYHSLPMIYAASRLTNTPLMWTVHGWWFKPKFWQRAFFRQIPVVARSYSIRDGFLGTPPFMSPEQIPVIYSGVDTERFKPTLDESPIRKLLNLDDTVTIVAMVARFQHVKGHHTFQAMARRILAIMPDVQFIIAGEDVFGVAADAAYKAQILETAQHDPLLRERLHYIGFRDDVENVFAAADVVVCPSDFESYGKVNLEAMASGKAVVSTNQGGPSETLINGETAYLVNAGDAQALAEKVLLLLQNPRERERIGQNGRKRVLEMFSAKASAYAYHTFFQELIKKK